MTRPKMTAEEIARCERRWIPALNELYRDETFVHVQDLDERRHGLPEGYGRELDRTRAIDAISTTGDMLTAGLRCRNVEHWTPDRYYDEITLTFDRPGHEGPHEWQKIWRHDGPDLFCYAWMFSESEPARCGIVLDMRVIRGKTNDAWRLKHFKLNERQTNKEGIMRFRVAKIADIIDRCSMRAVVEYTQGHPASRFL